VLAFLFVYPVAVYYMAVLVRAGPETEEEADRPIEVLQPPMPARSATATRVPYGTAIAAEPRP